MPVRECDSRNVEHIWPDAARKTRDSCVPLWPGVQLRSAPSNGSTRPRTAVTGVLVADGHAVAREGLKAFLGAERDMRVVGATGGSAEAAGLLEVRDPLSGSISSARAACGSSGRALHTLDYDGTAITAARLGSGVRVGAGAYVLATTPFAAADILERTPALAAQEQLRLFRPLTRRGRAPGSPPSTSPRGSGSWAHLMTCASPSARRTFSICS
jgi:hypothetical protein